MAKAVGNEGMVIAIEPEENNLRSLKRNIERARLKNVIIIPKALWSSKQTMRLNLHNRHDSHNLVSAPPKANNLAESETVETDTLDNILAEINVSKVDFIKMNIEGAELEALKGARQTLKNNNIKLAIEAHHEIDGEPAYVTVIPWLGTAQFDAFLGENGVVYARKILG